MVKITNVIPKDDYTLSIELNNLHKIIFNMRPKLNTVRFSKLRDKEKFKSFKIDNGNTIFWDNFCMISIDEIINSIER